MDFISAYGHTFTNIQNPGDLVYVLFADGVLDLLPREIFTAGVTDPTFDPPVYDDEGNVRGGNAWVYPGSTPDRAILYDPGYVRSDVLIGVQYVSGGSLLDNLGEIAAGVAGALTVGAVIGGATGMDIGYNVGTDQPLTENLGAAVGIDALVAGAALGTIAAGAGEAVDTTLLVTEPAGAEVFAEPLAESVLVSEPILDVVPEITIGAAETLPAEPAISAEALTAETEALPAGLVGEPPMTPAVVTAAAKPGVVAGLAQSAGSLAAAEKLFQSLYTKVKGTGPAPATYQRTAAGSGSALDESGLGANLTPLLKQLAIPAIAIVAAIFAKG